MENESQTLVKSSPNNLFTNEGNGLVIFIDATSGEVSLKDYKGTTKLLSDFIGGGDFIPRSGTVEGKPVTGSIELESSLYYGDKSTEEGRGVFQFDGNYPTLYYQSSLGINGSTTVLIINEYGVRLSDVSNEDAKGIYANIYFGANYDDNTYVQKKYVDDNMINNQFIEDQPAELKISGRGSFGGSIGTSSLNVLGIIDVIDEDNNIVIGKSNSNTFSNCIMIGTKATATADNQLVLASTDNPLNGIADEAIITNRSLTFLLNGQTYKLPLLLIG